MCIRRPALGFALIEALITLVIVMVGLTGVLRMQATLVAASADAKARDEAVAIAQNGAAEVQAIHTTAGYRQVRAETRVIAGQLHDYRLSISPTCTPAPAICKIVTQVHWPDSRPTRHIELQVLIFEQDIDRIAYQQLQLTDI